MYEGDLNSSSAWVPKTAESVTGGAIPMIEAVAKGKHLARVLPATKLESVKGGGVGTSLSATNIGNPPCIRVRLIVSACRRNHSGKESIFIIKPRPYPEVAGQSAPR